MQVGQQVIPFAAQSDRVFTKHQLKNRVELVDDFPNSAEIICSLQVIYIKIYLNIYIN